MVRRSARRRTWSGFPRSGRHRPRGSSPWSCLDVPEHPATHSVTAMLTAEQCPHRDHGPDCMEANRDMLDLQRYCDRPSRLPCADERDRLEDRRLRCRWNRRLLRIGFSTGGADVHLDPLACSPPPLRPTDGLTIETADGTTHQRLHATADPADIGPVDVVLFVPQVLRHRQRRESHSSHCSHPDGRRVAPERHRQRGEDR